jgi:hypothetical protein
MFFYLVITELSFKKKLIICSVHICRFCYLFLQGGRLGRMVLLILDRWCSMKNRIDLTLCVADLCILMPAIELFLWIIT